MLLIGQHHVPEEAAVFVLSLVKAARRALLSAGVEPDARSARAGPGRDRAGPGEPDRG
jgi:hypothetical protein